MRKVSMVGASLVALALGLPACNAVMNLDRFSGDEAGLSGSGGSSLSKSFVFVLKSMSPHPAQLFEYRVIDANNFIQSRGLLDPMGGNDVEIHVPNAMLTQGGPYRVDFYADNNNSRSYDGIGSTVTDDHAWRFNAPLETAPGAKVEGDTITIEFIHNTVFTDMNTAPDGTKDQPARDTEIPATVHFKNMSQYEGKLVQVRVLAEGTKHTVGLYRFPRVLKAEFDAVIPGVVEQGVTYSFDVYVDANGNGIYDNPTQSDGDHGWHILKEADVTGVTLDFDPSSYSIHSYDVGPP